MGTYEISHETTGDLRILSEPVPETHLSGMTYEDFIGCGHTTLAATEVQLAYPDSFEIDVDSFSLRAHLTA